MKSRCKKILYVAFMILLCCSISIVGVAQGMESAQKAAFDTLKTTFLITQEESGFVKMAETSSLALYVMQTGESAGEFFIFQKDTGYCWYSNPQSRFDDTSSKGIPKMTMYSQFSMTYYDKELSAEKATNSYTGASQSGNIIIKSVENGVKLIYRFESIKIAIPLYILLKEDTLVVRINAEEIVEQGIAYVMSISMLPYLGSAGKDENGFLFVPDGSGGIINFNNGKTETAYKQTVFGSDPGFSSDSGSYNSQQIHLPVFGLSRTGGAYLGVISSGAASASMNGYVSGLYNSQNNVFACFTIRNQGKVVIGDTSSSITASAIHYDTEHLQVSACAITYSFLSAGATYTDMAKCYRQYLLDSGGLAANTWQDEPALILEFYAGIIRQENILGFPVDQYKTLTTFEQASEIAGNFKTAGVPRLITIMRNADKAESIGKLQNKVRLQSGLGGESGLAALSKQSEKVYLTYQPFSITSSGNGFYKLFNMAKRFDKNPMIVYTYKTSTMYKDATALKKLLMRPDLLPESASSYAASISKLNTVQSATLGLGTLLYGNYDSKQYLTRTQAVDDMSKSLSSLNGAVYAPNSYALPYAKTVLDLPSTDSKYTIVDYAVPFYQMVLSGLAEFSNKSANLGTDLQKEWLQCAETGASLKVTLVAQNVTETIDTDYDYLCGTDYTAWRETFENMQMQLVDLFNQLGSREMQSNVRLADDVYKTTYTSGKSVVVNFRSEPVQTKDGLVDAKSWLMVD